VNAGGRGKPHKLQTPAAYQQKWKKKIEKNRKEKPKSNKTRLKPL